MTGLPIYTIEDVMKTVDTTLIEYQNVYRRFASDPETLSLLHILSQTLDRVQDRLESTADDDDVLAQLESITVGETDKERPFLSVLNVDMQTICAYLQSAASSGSPLENAEINVYAEALHRYGKVLKAIHKKKKKSVMVIYLFLLMADSFP
jgi:hypothetical protein